MEFDDLLEASVEERTTIFRNHAYFFDIESEADEIVIQVSWVDIGEKRRQLTEDSCIRLDMLKLEKGNVLDFVGCSNHFCYSASLRSTRNEPGTYIVIPTTLKSGQTRQYFGHVFSTCKVNLRKSSFENIMLSF